MFSPSIHILINRQEGKLNSTVRNFWNKPSATCNWGTAHSPNDAAVTSSTVLNTELTTIRAIIPAEQASVHWLRSKRQHNNVQVCLFRKIDREDQIMLNCADHKAWSMAFNSFIHSQSFVSGWSGEQSCTILPEARSISFWKLSISVFSFKEQFDTTHF